MTARFHIASSQARRSANSCFYSRTVGSQLAAQKETERGRHPRSVVDRFNTTLGV